MTTVEYDFNFEERLLNTCKNDASGIMKIDRILNCNDESNYFNSMQLIGIKSNALSSVSGDVDHHKEIYLRPVGRTDQKAVKKYACHICSRKFSRTSSVKAHLYTHTGEKPFECKTPGCVMRFSVMSNLRRHNKKCHNKSF